MADAATPAVLDDNETNENHLISHTVADSETICATTAIAGGGGDDTQSLLCCYCYKNLDGGVVYCEGCSNRPYCSPECRARDSDPHGDGQKHSLFCSMKCGEQNVHYRIKFISQDKGMGVVAVVPFKRGDRIMVERALEVSAGRQTISGHHAASVYSALMDLAPKGGAVANKITINSLACPGLGADGSGMCVIMSRCNHCCNENSCHRYSPNLGVVFLVATRDISIGEEICFSYISLFDVANRGMDDNLKIKLRTVWGIQCPSDCACKNKQLLATWRSMQKLDDQILRAARMMMSKEAMTLADELIKLELQQHVGFNNLFRTYYDAFQTGIMQRQYVSQGLQYINRAYVESLAVYGPHDEETIKYRKFLNDPKQHINYQIAHMFM